jgi:hypothetical protein
MAASISGGLQVVIELHCQCRVSIHLLQATLACHTIILQTVFCMQARNGLKSSQLLSSSLHHLLCWSLICRTT